MGIGSVVIDHQILFGLLLFFILLFSSTVLVYNLSCGLDWFPLKAMQGKDDKHKNGRDNRLWLFVSGLMKRIQSASLPLTPRTVLRFVTEKHRVTCLL